MFCSNSHQNRTMMEKELRKLKLTAFNDTSRCNSILKSFVNDLSFWSSATYENTNTGHVFINKQRNIPTMTEAIDMSKGENNGSREKSTSLPKAIWKSAIDSSSGKTYYYDAISRKTQWQKPAILKATEKRKKKEQMRIARKFFNEMEKNIINSMAKGEVCRGGVPFLETAMLGPPKEPLPVGGKLHVRTISGMHGVQITNDHDKATIPKVISQKRTKRNPALIAGRPPLPGSNRTRLKDFDDDVKLPQQGIDVNESKVSHTRRNTGGTIYLQNSMTNPNIKATIQCVCGVYLAHIVQSNDKRQNDIPRSFRDYNVFDDARGSPKKRKSSKVKVPTLMEVLEFYEGFYQRSQMEHDTIITSLIYVERVIKNTNAILVPTTENWRSFLFACMVLASKVWDDLSMWNIDFSNVTAHTAGLSSFTLSRINELELALLKCLKFNVKVPASEYAKVRYTRVQYDGIVGFVNEITITLNNL
jgi:hypothetical protein